MDDVEVGSKSETVGWRAEAKRRQLQALDGGPTVVSGTGPYGVGGLGQHLAALVEALDARGQLRAYVSPQPRPGDIEAGTGVQVEVPVAARTAMAVVPAVRWSPGRRIRLRNAAFDYAAARQLPSDAEHLLAFNGSALRQLAAARRSDYQSVGLVSANPHLAHVARQHERAWQQHPIERPWGPANVTRNLAEYRSADFVHVSSRYVWESFVAEGFPEDRLRFFPLTPNLRYQPRSTVRTAKTFNVVYVGSLSVHKGTPVLIEAFRRLPQDDLRLVLVGGWGTRPMRHYIQVACARDPRIMARPGDPLPHFMQAGVCVHPSYEEGSAYAPAEAMACGVPLIASEDTGMNDMLAARGVRRTVPTGDVAALAEAIEAAYLGSWPDRPSPGI